MCESLKNEGSVNRHQYTVGWPRRGDIGTKIHLKRKYMNGGYFEVYFIKPTQPSVSP
jgi:hypothetical protein